MRPPLRGLTVVVLSLAAAARAIERADPEGRVLAQQAAGGGGGGGGTVCAPDDPTCQAPPSPPPDPLRTVRTRFTTTDAPSTFDATRTLAIKRAFASILPPPPISEAQLDTSVGISIVSSGATLGGSYLTLIVLASEAGSARVLNATIHAAVPEATNATQLLAAPITAVPLTTIVIGSPPDGIGALTAIAVTSPPSPPPPPSPSPPPYPPPPPTWWERFLDWFLGLFGMVPDMPAHLETLIFAGFICLLLLVLTLVALCLCWKVRGRLTGKEKLLD